MPKPYTALPQNEVTPEPKLEKRTRRRFSSEYKLRILAKADACGHGELRALLRREKLQSRQLQQWRRELATGGVEGLSKSAPDPEVRRSQEKRRIEQFEQEKAQLIDIDENSPAITPQRNESGLPCEGNREGSAPDANTRVFRVDPAKQASASVDDGKHTPSFTGLLTPKARDIVQITGVVGVILAAIALAVQVIQFRAETQVRRSALLSLSWETVNRARDTGAKSDQGQVAAVEFLATNFDISGADLSKLALPRLGTTARRPLRLRGVDLSEADLRDSVLYEAILAESDLSGANLST
jgi:transposase